MVLVLEKGDLLGIFGDLQSSFFFYQREHRTNLQPDMKGCFIEVLYQGEKRQLSQKLNFLAKINFWEKVLLSV